MNSLKKLKRVIEEIEKPDFRSPKYLYSGDFVRCRIDGEVYIVTVRWDNEAEVYKWNLISLRSGIPLEGLRFDEWISSTSGGSIRRDEFWEDMDIDWEVINIDSTEKEDRGYDCNDKT